MPFANCTLLNGYFKNKFSKSPYMTTCYDVKDKKFTNKWNT